MAVIVRVDHLEGEDLTLLARPEAGGSTLFRNEVSAATLKVYEKGSDTAVLDKTLDPNALADPTGADDNCMFATAQTDDGWTLSGGYTFVGFVRDSEYHLDGGKQYRVEVALTAGHTAPTGWPQQTSYGDLLYVWWVNVIPTASA